MRTYIKFLDAFRRLNDAHDQTIQAQKRELIRKLMDAVMLRLLELKKVRGAFECGEIRVSSFGNHHHCLLPFLFPCSCIHACEGTGVSVMR